MYFHFGSCYSTAGVRLVEGKTPNQGRLEVRHRGQWGTVCGWVFGTREVEVACRQLGYSGAGFVLPLGVPDPVGDIGPILLDGLSCMGDEWALEMCYHYGWGKLEHDCQHMWDVWLFCEEDSEPADLVKPEKEKDEEMQADESHKREACKKD